MKRFLLGCILVTATAISAWAGDVAVFVNLGFSPDSHVFMFGQYGITGSGTMPFADIYTVNVAADRFEPNGIRGREFKVPVNPGQDGIGALYTLLEQNVSLVQRYHIDHLSPGRIVYLLMNGQDPKSHIVFRDFVSGDQYDIDLIQHRRTSGGHSGASFHILLKVTLSNGQEHSFTVGVPGFVRADVAAYRIRQVVLAPDGRSLVFVIEKEYPTPSGPTIRYMVNTVVFR